MSQSQSSSVVHSLQTVQDKLKLRLMKLPEYRAFLAIDRPIAEVADIPDLVAHLHTAKHKILDRLTTTQEYRALLTVEKAIKDISEILDVVGNDATVDAEAAALETTGETKELSAPSAAAAEGQQSIATVAVTASPGKAPAATAAAAATEMAEIPTQDAADLDATIETPGERPMRSVSNPPERLSTLGLVEEWRLTALVRESYAANLSDEETRSAGEGTAGAEEAKVA
jgi:hypothetical protein